LAVYFYESVQDLQDKLNPTNSKPNFFMQTKIAELQNTTTGSPFFIRPRKLFKQVQLSG
jgi:hypothetical protein